MELGVWMLYEIPNAATKRAHFGESAFPLDRWFDPTILPRAAKTPDAVGLTTRDDYFADEGDPTVDELAGVRS